MCPLLQVFKVNETQSGGVGADEEDGQPVNAVHPFEFMGGRLATMIWEDGVRLVGGGDDTNQSASAIIPDGHPGSGSSVPGGPGVRATSAPSTGAPEPDNPNSGKTKPGKTKPGRSKKSKNSHDEERAGLVSKANMLLDKLSNSVEEESTESRSAFAGLQVARSTDRAMEDLVDDVERLQGKVDGAQSDKTRQRFQKLLDAAEARLEKAEAAQKEPEAAAAASSALAHSAAPPTSPAGGVDAGEDVASWEPLELEQLPAISRALAETAGGGGLCIAGAGGGEQRGARLRRDPGRTVHW